MAKYLIKATYLDGPHAGRVYYLTKGGYVTRPDLFHVESRTYDSESAAKRQCTRLDKDNLIDVKYSSGKWARESYEPYELSM